MLKVRMERQPRYSYIYGLLVWFALIGMMLFLLVGCALVTDRQQVSSIGQETHAVGETFKMGNFQYKVNSVRTLEANEVKPPRDGNTFLLVGLTVENQGRTDAEIRSSLGFKLKDKDGRRHDFSLGADLAVKDALDGTIPAGGTMTGELGYEVVKGMQTFELAVIPDPLSSKAKIATIKIPVQ